MENMDVKQNDEKEAPQKSREDNKEDDIFTTKEITIEEMAIDGICGVY